jgi:ABC-type nitrate/sulfonate/bicarbonate transport system substrate-binding protein
MPAHITRRSALLGGLTALAAPSVSVRAADTIGVGMISRTFFYLPLWCSIHQGFMKEEGLDLVVQNPDTSDEVNKLLRSGEVKFVLRSPEASMMDAYRGGSLRVVAGGIHKLPHFIIANPRIKTLADLRGANFGVLAEKEGTTYIVQDIARAAGLTPADYKISVVGGSPARWKLLKEGKIDVGLQPIPNSYEAEAAGFTNLGSVIPFVPDWQFTAVNVDQKWADPNFDKVIRFLRALQRGRDFINTNPAETAKIAAEELRSKVELTTRMLVDIEKYQMLAKDTAVNEPGLIKVFETLQKAGDIAPDKKFDMNVFTDLTYYADSREPAFTGTIPTRPPAR